MWPGHKSGRQRDRPTSRYPPSLHALKDWWDKSGITWFLRGQTSDKLCQCKKSRSSLFILNNRTWRTFYVEDDNGNLWVKISPPTPPPGENDHCYFSRSSSDRKMSSEQVIMSQTCRNLNCTFCMTMKLSSRFERLKKLDRDFLHWQILFIVFPLRNDVTLLISHRSEGACKDGRYRE